jgi:ferric-dicitrate binding protein FerR (iron transport regulator)
MPTPTNMYDQIAAFLSGNLDKEAEQALMAWREENAENEAVFQDCKLLWQVGKVEVKTANWNTDLEWDKFLSEVSNENEEAKVVPLKPKNNLWKWGIAASMALLISFVFWYAQPEKMIQVYAEAGSQKEVVLPDGSTVWLNANSSLSYPESFKTRAVILVGEAFFEVEKDPTSPFTIQAQDSKTTVLGTSFNVRAYPDEPNVEVTVATGKVSLSEDEKEIFLAPGETGIFEKKTEVLKTLDKPLKHAEAWRTGVLNFENEPLSEIIPVLERLYKFQIDLENPAIANCRFSGSFKEAQPEEILDVIAYALSLEKTDAQGAIVLDGEGCN